MMEQQKLFYHQRKGIAKFAQSNFSQMVESFYYGLPKTIIQSVVGFVENILYKQTNW